MATFRVLLDTIESVLSAYPFGFGSMPIQLGKEPLHHKGDDGQPAG
ncbi:hypothetical protein ACSTK6_01455 [Vibrio parahaemolyticus]